jgi:hypothetical protein
MRVEEDEESIASPQLPEQNPEVSPLDDIRRSLNNSLSS